MNYYTGVLLSENNPPCTASVNTGQIICIDLHRLPELNYGFGFDLDLAEDNHTPIIVNVKHPYDGEYPNYSITTKANQRSSFTSTSSNDYQHTSSTTENRTSSLFTTGAATTYISQYGGQNKIQNGDHLIEISGISVKMLSLTEIEKLLRCSGSRVLIKIHRPTTDTLAAATASIESYKHNNSFDSQVLDCLDRLELSADGNCSTVNKGEYDCEMQHQDMQYMSYPTTLHNEYQEDDMEAAGNNGDVSHFLTRINPCNDFNDDLNASSVDNVPSELIEAAKRLANRLYNLDGFKAGDVAFEICKANKFSNTVAEQFMERFNFKSMNLDTALRTMLLQFTLPGSVPETDPIKYELAIANREKIINLFAIRYIQCNPQAFEGSVDACYILTCSLLLLNTDLHGFVNHHNNGGRRQTIRHKKMSLSDFRKNLKATDWACKFDADNLKQLYNSIKHEALTTLDPSLDVIKYSTSNPDINCRKYNEGRESEDCHLSPAMTEGSKVGSTTSCVSLRHNSGKKQQNRAANSVANATNINDGKLVPSLLVNVNAPLVFDFRKSLHANFDSITIATSNDGRTVVHNSASELLYDNGRQLAPKLPLDNETTVTSTRFSGWLLRKCQFDESGKRTSLLKRSWTRYFSKLDDLNLWFYRNENQSNSAPVDCIQLHHSLSHIIGLHKKRTNVFVLRLATNCLSMNANQQLCLYRQQHGAEYMFQASSDDDMNQWVFLFNLSAALFSSPPLAPPVGNKTTYCGRQNISSKARFVRETEDRIIAEENIGIPYPRTNITTATTISTNNIPVQQKQWFSKQIVVLDLKLKEIGSKATTLSPYIENDGVNDNDVVQLIHHEINRYSIYIQCIEQYLKTNETVFDGSLKDFHVYPNQPQQQSLCTLREDCSLTLSEEVQSGNNQMGSTTTVTAPSSILKRDAVVVVSSS
ncbi:hypothetical protein GJ496_000093 [Pomphorhynchus laevis]|nr:hypothetical protein GJ496_000093 [Pomphorhynchus laevis]